MTAGWRFWIDRGGTFTDVVARRPDGSLATLKILSSDAERYADPVVEGIRRILASETGGTDYGKIDTVRIGSTIATNALLEGRGEPTILVTTRGFGDALWIAYQNRPDIFALDIKRPDPLYTDVIETDERLLADGSVGMPLDEVTLERDLSAARKTGSNSLAIAFLHAHQNPAHERLAAEIARDVGFEHVALSSEVSPLIRFVARGQTTVVDAYLTPLVQHYFQQLDTTIGKTLYFMQSNGGLAAGDRVRGKDVVFSGPAGGVVGMVRCGEKEGYDRLIGFDMGGTSTDVSVFNGALQRREETLLKGMRLQVPSLDVHSVASGGGSILSFDGMRLGVGDESAGADPGPAAYGRGGPLTITDCQVLLGRLRPEYFPCIFGTAADDPLDLAAVRSLFETLTDEVSEATNTQRQQEALAFDFLEIAIRKMASAVRRLTISRGLDPSDFALVAFGGAAGQHACSVASELRIDSVVVPPAAGLLSAHGIGIADVREVRQHAVERPCASATLEALKTVIDEMASEVSRSIESQGVARDHVSTIRAVRLHYEGVDASIQVKHDTADACRRAFVAAHAERYGFSMPDRRIMISSVEVEGVGVTRAEGAFALPEAPKPTVRRVWFQNGWEVTPFIGRSALAHESVSGPAIVIDDDTATVVEPGWTACLTENGVIRLSRDDAHPAGANWSTDVDPMHLEIFANLFMSIAEQMGDRLQRTARSVNVKERLDYSCALFDQDGNLIANAPHMPVHLGAMSDTVRIVLQDRGHTMKDGDAFLVNDPFKGGTHLPDLTVVSPIFVNSHRMPVAFVASRAHHADVGGKVPGSMPSNAVSSEEEGIRFDGLQIVGERRFLEDDIRRILSSGPYPARNPDANIGDLRAQVAANHAGITEFRRTVGRYGFDIVSAYMEHVRANAEQTTRTVIRSLDGGTFSVQMDSGQEIRVAIRVDNHTGSAVVDFSGTSPQAANSLNAPRAITVSAVLYVLRCLAGGNLPLNEGCLEPVTIVVPKGCMLNPVAPAAVAGGNVETSQNVVDALLGALQIEAGSQGTMNNLAFGDATTQYYETICGGTGAGADFDGASAVHSHMTNSRITDPEILETRMPVVIEEFSIRRRSGGDGKHKGGNGAVRRIRFLKPMTLTVLSNRRKVAPHGLAGGRSGSTGSNRIIRVSGDVEPIGPTVEASVVSGDILVVETPGGGGFGRLD